MYKVLIQHNHIVREYYTENIVRAIQVIQNRIYRHKDKVTQYYASRELDSEGLSILSKRGVISYSYHKVR